MFRPAPSAYSCLWELVQDVLCDGNMEPTQRYRFVRRWLAHMIHRGPLGASTVRAWYLGSAGGGKSVFGKVGGSQLHPRHYNPNVALSAVRSEGMGRDRPAACVPGFGHMGCGNKVDQGALQKFITGSTDRINDKFLPAGAAPTWAYLSSRHLPGRRSPAAMPMLTIDVSSEPLPR